MGDRQRGLRPNPHTLGVEPLAPGDASAALRIRCDADALAAFVALSPAQRGHVVEAWYTPLS